MSVFHRTDFSLWLHCSRHLWGLDEDVMLGAVYVPPQSTHFSPSRVVEHFTDLFDEVFYASQVSSNILLMGDFNAKIGTLDEVAESHSHIVHAFPDLQRTRTSKFIDVNTAGTLLVDFASATGMIICTGRTQGDEGQASYYSRRHNTRNPCSRLDHFILSPSLFGVLQRCKINPKVPPFDHATISAGFKVTYETAPNVDWHTSRHVCRPGGCGERYTLQWIPTPNFAYVKKLEENHDMERQFMTALEQGDSEKACFCLRSWITQAAGDPDVGMGRRQAVCSTLKNHSSDYWPIWFDSDCAALKYACAVASRWAHLHEYKQLYREYKRVTQRAKRLFIARQRDDFLFKLSNNDPSIHDMLRKPKHTQQTPIASTAWEHHLHQHFGSAPLQQHQPRHEQQQQTQHQHAGIQPGGSSGWGEWLRRGASGVLEGVQRTASSARDTAQRVTARWTGGLDLMSRHVAVPVGRHQPPPEQTFRARAHGCVPPSDPFDIPSLADLEGIIRAELSKMKSSSSPGFECISVPFLKHAVKVEPNESGPGVKYTNVLVPYLAKLFQLLMRQTKIPDDWKIAKLNPLHKKGAVIDPINYRMLAVSGTFYRLYANVLRSLLTRWCYDKGKIPDFQFGFYPGRSTLHPIFILRHLINAARYKKPGGFPHLHAAFIDFSSAYDTVPRESLWCHLRNNQMPDFFLKILQDIYEGDEYILVDGCKRVRVHPLKGLKQGCPLSPLLFALYVNDIGEISEGAEGATSGLDGVRVSQLLYADDLCLLANDTGVLQRMLNRLHHYAAKKSLIVNTNKSNVMHFNSTSAPMPALIFGAAEIPLTDTFKYLGMVFDKSGNMQTAAEHALHPFVVGTYRIRSFVQEHLQGCTPRAYLWLARVYAIPAAMHASQVWSTPYLKEGKEFNSCLQTWHLNLLRSILGVKTTTPNWAVLRECGQEPMQFYWFRSVARFYNGMLASNSPLVRQVLQADIRLGERCSRCWAAQVRQAFGGLPRADMYNQAVQELQCIQTTHFIPDLRYRQQAVWRMAEDASPNYNINKLPVYHHWFAEPRGFNNENSKCPYRIPFYLSLNLPRCVSRHVSCFRLRAHRLRIESSHWQGQPIWCDCGCNEVQDERHVLFYCRHPAVCSLRDKYFDLFEGRTLGFSFQASAAGRNLYLEPECVIQDWQMFEFMHQQNYRLCRFISELYRIFL